MTVRPPPGDEAGGDTLRPVRVLVVTNMYPSPERPALGRFVRDQVEALREIDGIQIEVHEIPPGRGSKGYLSAARQVRRRIRDGRYDVVHAHYGLSALGAVAAAAVRTVVTFHGTDLADPGAARISRYVARRAGLPATVSASLARERLDGAGRDRRVAVLPCGVDLERFRPADRRAARGRLGLDPDGRYLLFPADPGRLEKHHDRALAVAAATGATLLTYSGTHPDDVPDHVNAANAVVAPSAREGFGLAPLEALACDVPVLSTPVGIAPVALRGIAGTLCAEFDRDRWAHAALGPLEDPDPRVRGRARAGVFDRRRMAARVERAYADLVVAAA